MYSKYFHFKSHTLKPWLWGCFIALLLQMYLNTGTLSGYAATMTRPTVYGGYYVNYDWPQYVANYKFIKGADHTEWEKGVVLRRQLMYVVGYPFFLVSGFFIGSMLTILASIFFALFFFFRFIEKEFGEVAAKVSMVLLCTYTGIMYWIGSPFVQNMIVPLCLGVYALMYKMQKGTFKENIIYLFLIGILFTGYDVLPLLGPGVMLFVFFNKNFPFRKRIGLIAIAGVAFIIPPLLIHFWLIARGANLNLGNDDTYKIIINAYLNIFNQIPTWWMRVKLVPETLFNCFFYSNFFALPILFLACWIPGRWILKFKLNLIECSLLVSILILFLFNNMAPPYQGEWQMWGDWIARIYQAVFIVFLMYIVRFSAFVFESKRYTWAFSILLFLTVIFNLVVNTGGLYASPLSSFIYGNFYSHGALNRYTLNIKYYGARPLGFPEHYETETK